MSIYIIYKTTNLINGKIYVGQHYIKPENSATDGYLGSGKILKQAVKKYGKENFEREILEVCTYENVADREIYWIEILDSRNSDVGYNLSLGGLGPRLLGEDNPNFGNKWTDEMKKESSDRMKGKYDGEKNPFYGKKHCKESLIKRSKMVIKEGTYKNENHPRWHKIDINKLKEMYDRGMLLKDIANYFGVDYQVLQRRFKKFNIKKKSRNTGHQTGDKNNGWKELNVEEMVKQFKKGKTQKEMAKHFKVCITTVKRRLREYLGQEEYLKILGERSR